MKRALIGLLGTIVLAGSYYSFLGRLTLPRYSEVVSHYRSSEGVLRDRHGNIIHVLRVDNDGRRLRWISGEHISVRLREAVIAAEDKRFLTHYGVDYRALVSALVHLSIGRYRGGASTISMQLASILAPNEGVSWTARLGSKLRQLHLAALLERSWSKEQILESYLNLVSFRGELRGVEAASQGLFGKSAQALNSNEALILATLIRSPNADVDHVKSRACRLAQSMRLNVTCGDLGIAAENALKQAYNIKPNVVLAPHIARKLLDATNHDVTSTLDRELQSFAVERLQAQLALLANSNVHDGAVLVVENGTGNVLAYVGNSGDASSAKYVDGVMARRQAGSTLKPFLYGLAIERRYLTAWSLLDDSPVEIPVSGGVYRPRNYDSQFHGLVHLDTALGSSLNVPAVRTLQLIGVDPFGRKLRELGFSLPNDPEYYGFSLALGSIEVSLWDLVNAYRVFVNDGKWSPLTLMEVPRNAQAGRKVFSSDVSFIVSHLLSDRDSRALTFDLSNILATRKWSGVKTGTSRDMTDNWCIGFNSKFTVGVWVGNFSGKSMWNVSGVSGAAPLWNEIVSWLEERYSSENPTVPQSVVSRDMGSDDNRRLYYFIRGTEPNSDSEQLPSPVSGFVKIKYPGDGLVVAIDPDIPQEQQAMLFDAEGVSTEMSWQLNGETLGPASQSFLWHPKRGRYELTVVDAGAEVVSSVKFRVQ